MMGERPARWAVLLVAAWSWRARLAGLAVALFVIVFVVPHLGHG